MPESGKGFPTPCPERAWGGRLTHWNINTSVGVAHLACYLHLYLNGKGLLMAVAFPFAFCARPVVPKKCESPVREVFPALGCLNGSISNP